MEFKLTFSWEGHSMSVPLDIFAEDGDLVIPVADLQYLPLLRDLIDNRDGHLSGLIRGLEMTEPMPSFWPEIETIQRLQQRFKLKGPALSEYAGVIKESCSNAKSVCQILIMLNAVQERSIDEILSILQTYDYDSDDASSKVMPSSPEVTTFGPACHVFCSSELTKDQRVMAWPVVVAVSRYLQQLDQAELADQPMLSLIGTVGFGDLEEPGHRSSASVIDYLKEMAGPGWTMFNRLKDWPAGLVLAGGALTSALANRDTDDLEEAEDLDFWIVGPTEEDRIQSFHRAISFILDEYTLTDGESDEKVRAAVETVVEDEDDKSGTKLTPVKRENPDAPKDKPRIVPKPEPDHSDDGDELYRSDDESYYLGDGDEDYVRPVVFSVKGAAVTLTISGPNRHIQLIFTNRKNMASLVTGFDMPHLRACFDGQTIGMTDELDLFLKTAILQVDLAELKTRRFVKLLRYNTSHMKVDEEHPNWIQYQYFLDSYSYLNWEGRYRLFQYLDADQAYQERHKYVRVHEGADTERMAHEVERLLEPQFITTDDAELFKMAETTDFYQSFFSVDYSGADPKRGIQFNRPKSVVMAQITDRLERLKISEMVVSSYHIKRSDHHVKYWGVDIQEPLLIDLTRVKVHCYYPEHEREAGRCTLIVPIKAKSHLLSMLMELDQGLFKLAHKSKGVADLIKEMDLDHADVLGKGLPERDHFMRGLLRPSYRQREEPTGDYYLPVSYHFRNGTIKPNQFNSEMIMNLQIKVDRWHGFRRGAIYMRRRADKIKVIKLLGKPLVSPDSTPASSSSASSSSNASSPEMVCTVPSPEMVCTVPDPDFPAPAIPSSIDQEDCTSMLDDPIPAVVPAVPIIQAASVIQSGAQIPVVPASVTQPRLEPLPVIPTQDRLTRVPGPMIRRCKTRPPPGWELDRPPRK